LLQAAVEGKLSKERLRSSLRRIAAMKSLVEPPLPLNMDRLKILSAEIFELNKKLNYTYGGTIK